MFAFLYVLTLWPKRKERVKERWPELFKVVVVVAI
jgi:hypothetical protein